MIIISTPSFPIVARSATILLCSLFCLLRPSIALPSRTYTLSLYSYNGMYQMDDPALGGKGCRSPNPFTANCTCQVHDLTTRILSIHATRRPNTKPRIVTKKKLSLISPQPPSTVLSSLRVLVDTGPKPDEYIGTYHYRALSPLILPSLSHPLACEHRLTHSDVRLQEPDRPS